MKIAFLGTKGIPNNYGGFEQFAEHLSLGLSARGHEVTVYTPHYHPFHAPELEQVKIKRFYCPENRIGPAAHFLYDFLCLSDAAKNNFDIIYEAGYQSSAFSIRFLKKKNHIHRIVTNLDGMEWKRSKWNGFVKYLTKVSEKIAVKHSDYLIADNIGIQKYFVDTYGIKPAYLPYGADVIDTFDDRMLRELGLEKNNFYLIIARLEPENNVEMMINGYLRRQTGAPLVIIGGLSTKYAGYLLRTFGDRKNIRFVGAVYNKQKLDNLRHFSKAYLHGHSVGGTNPSLLEAMASSAFILSHDNEFNRSVLNNNALYFTSSDRLTENLDLLQSLTETQVTAFKKNNVAEIASKYNWPHVVDMHEKFFRTITLP